MRRSRLARLALLTAACALATIALGWPGIVFVAGVFAIIDGRVTVPGEVAAGGACAWAAIAIFVALGAGAERVGVVGAALGVPAVLVPLVGVAFAAALAWSTAAVALLLRAVAMRAPSRPA